MSYTLTRQIAQESHSTYGGDSLTKRLPFELLSEPFNKWCSAGNGCLIIIVRPLAHLESEREIFDAGTTAGLSVANQKIVGQQLHFYLIIRLNCINHYCYTAVYFAQRYCALLVAGGMISTARGGSSTSYATSCGH
jgi:hypothetical protein